MCTLSLGIMIIKFTHHHHIITTSSPHHPPMHPSTTHAPSHTPTHARPSLLFDPDPNPTPPNQRASTLHDIAAIYCVFHTTDKASGGLLGTPLVPTAGTPSSTGDLVRKLELVVYFKQSLGVVHSRSGSKYAFAHFQHKKADTGRKKRKIGV